MVLSFAILVTVLIGWLVVSRWVRCGWVEGVALGFAAGVGILSLQMLLYGLVPLPWHPAAVLLPWAAVGMFQWRAILRGRDSLNWKNLDWLEWLLLAACLVAPLAWLPYERVMPLTTRGWDAWAIWLFKAKAFYLDGNLAGFLARAGEFDCQPSYPLLIPLYGTFLYKLAGAPAEHLAKAMSPCFFFSLLGAFYYLARRFGSRPVALAFTAMLANLHMANIVAFELAGYADTALSVYLLLGAGFLYAWWKEGAASDLVLASLFSSLAAWTKNEGVFFLAGVALLVLAGWIRRGTAARAATVWALIWPALAVVPWMVVRRVYGVPGSDLLGGGAPAWRNLGTGFESILGQAAKANVYNLTFWLLVASLLLFRYAGVGTSWWLLPGLVFWQMAGLLMAYLSPRNDIQWWIGTSLDRILSQIAPLALLGPALALAAWMNSRPVAPKAPPKKPERRRKREAQRRR